MRARLRLKNRRGATAIILVLMIPVVIGMVALTVDVGRLTLERQKLSNVCDACAKAGGIDLPTAASGDVNADLEQAEESAQISRFVLRSPSRNCDPVRAPMPSPPRPRDGTQTLEAFPVAYERAGHGPRARLRTGAANHPTESTQ